MFHKTKVNRAVASVIAAGFAASLSVNTFHFKK